MELKQFDMRAQTGDDLDPIRINGHVFLQKIFSHAPCVMLGGL
jgi:hypothetical protein